jgi:predicted FMN-binding regulatory protein PaiB
LGCDNRTLQTSAKGHVRAVPNILAQARLRTIVGVGIPLDAIEGKMKLNRDKSIKDRLRVIAALEERGGENGMAIADVIRSQPDILVAIAG